jgi:hypothetical protein
VKPKKAEDEQDDDHKADEIDDAVHGGHLARHNPSADCGGSDKKHKKNGMALLNVSTRGNIY